MEVKTPLIVANWKANKDKQGTIEWIDKVGEELVGFAGTVVVCPPFVYLEAASRQIRKHRFNLYLGGQDLSPFSDGAFTGEVTARMLAEFASFVIIGHSERRRLFGETEEIISQKLKQARANNLEPILCVRGGQDPVPDEAKIIAYEPVFAIGTGNPDTPENAQKVAGQIKQRRGNSMVLYGGSLTSANAYSFLTQKDLSGALVGGASLSPREFVKILRSSS